MKGSKDSGRPEDGAPEQYSIGLVLVDEEEEGSVRPENRHGAVSVYDGAGGGGGLSAPFCHFHGHFVDHLTHVTAWAEGGQLRGPFVEHRAQT